ncbi:hypothetical protein, variant 2 [Aphanomyces invadans]|uniref:Uncharacterized protein n=1 Tax=Aphanomyces invadans TaxID=157072 RepID=A0A024U4B6_9STRA|nr:hypothetical protein H310_06699 [Aphanomyces invadans]XP_008870073.1 hypothetical protein, variant 1 [Aphanomyces invadans]XP_008870074.1 hypothetical protein, variant 2 [Aphanomyces invadans]ETW01074.1 hypothetical protein H310_06699 [Aphanomyces invadans]ETW01075.1 hypothetical protein, variant 1 [Aphanomyces invadans]ETW01076.1 hypothetical protein, variant 2 [Aphanomyces invadans]|eukprot:XP_008870072.1 hypothetical protein H310_06699 [Aphanomyces invadans]
MRGKTVVAHQNGACCVTVERSRTSSRAAASVDATSSLRSFTERICIAIQYTNLSETFIGIVGRERTCHRMMRRPTIVMSFDSARARPLLAASTTLRCTYFAMPLARTRRDHQGPSSFPFG